MSKRTVSVLVGLAILVLGSLSVRAVAQAQGSTALVKTAPAQILVNAQGMTLYLFTPDKPGRSLCTGQCAAYWPPVLLPKGAAASTVLPGVSGTFGVAVRADGSRQLTFAGAPLYTFVKDRKPGDMKGQGAQGVWWAVVAGGATQPAVGAGEDNHGGHRHQGEATPGPQPQATATSTAGGGYYGNGGQGSDG